MKNLVRLSAAVGVAAALATAGVSASAAASTSVNPAAAPAVAGPLVAAPVVTAGQQTYTAIAPCRLANTHIAATKFIEVNGVRNFAIRGAGAAFAAQGGTAGGCGIPLTATAITTTVNATASTVQNIYNSGYLQGYPAGTAPGTANFLAFKNGGTSGNPTLTLTANGTEPSLSIKSLGGRTEIALDVTGYFEPVVAANIAGSVSGTGALLPGSNGLASATRDGTGAYTVTTDSDVTGCSPTVTALNPTQNATATVSGPNQVKVNVTNLIGGTAADGPFNVNLTC